MAQNAKSNSNQLTILDDFIGICRVCMSKSDAMENLFHSDRKYIEEIKFCTGILFAENNKLPSSICLNCQIKLTEAHKFKATCTSSEDSFQRLLQDLVKIDVGCDKPKTKFCVKKEIDDNEVNVDDDFFIEDIQEAELVIDKMTAPKRRTPSLKKGKLGKLWCTTCDIYFKSSKDSLEHQESFHKEVLVKEEKDDNDYCFLQDLKESEIVINRVNAPVKEKPRPTKGKFRKLYCITCDIHFKCRKDSLEHQETYHKEDQEWICEVCGKLYTVFASYYSHSRSHKRSHACDQCDYSCGYKSDLIKHIRMHKGEKRYQCHLCPNLYRTSSSLRSHELRSHICVKPFACDLCSRRFFDKQKLKRHHDTHFNIKRHECQVCHAHFSRRCQWRLHLQKQHNVFMPRMRPGRQKADDVLKNIPNLFYK